jgi:hypothetical protein
MRTVLYPDCGLASVVKSVSFVLTQPRFELQVNSLSPVLGSTVRISRERARIIVQQHLQSQIVAAVGNENYWYLAFCCRTPIGPRIAS